MAARLLAFEPERCGRPHGRIEAMAQSVRAPGRPEWPGDERAVTRFLAGDVTGFEMIVRQYSEMVFCLAARLVGPAEAEDVVQETFLRAYRALDRFRGESSLKTWLYAIALNRVRVRQGTLARFRKLFTRLGKTDPENENELYFADPPDPSASPEEDAMTAERRRMLRDAMRALPEEFRTAVLLRDLDGLSYTEIADALKVPIGTVRSRIARGRALLKEHLS
jgi:RNA polymerase sigma-70 factor (ECF subfamily)